MSESSHRVRLSEAVAERGGRATWAVVPGANFLGGSKFHHYYVISSKLHQYFLKIQYMCLGSKGFNTDLVEGTQGVLTVHGLGGAILALHRELATHATPLVRSTTICYTYFWFTKVSFHINVLAKMYPIVVYNRTKYTSHNRLSDVLSEPLSQNF